MVAGRIPSLLSDFRTNPRNAGVAMKRFVLGFMLAALAASQSFANDGAARWSGFYVGGNAGYAWNKMEATDIGDQSGVYWRGGTYSNRTGGFTGGVQAGYNFQNGPWVTGIEADFGWLNLKGSAAPFFDTFLNTDASYAATFRGKLGYAFDRGLFYVTGGAMLADFGNKLGLDLSGIITPTSATGSQWGWTAGAGFEWALDARWSVKTEYLYYGFGKETATVPGCGLGGCRFDIENNGSIVRIGLNYKLGSR